MSANDSPATKPECGWVRLHHESGVQVTLPVGCVPTDYAAMYANVSAALRSGWLVNAPGLEDGENKDVCGWVVRGQKDGRTGTADVIDLYLPDDIFTKVRCYLNTADDVLAFERASGLVVEKLPIYVGDNKLERGKSRQTDAFIVKLHRPFPFVWKSNPAYDADDDAKKMKPKRLFVRWADQKPPAEAPQPMATTTQPAPAGLPGNGQEMHRRLRDYDAKLSQQKLCQIGALLSHVTQAGIRAGYSPNLSEWSGEAIAFSVDAVKKFEASVRKATGLQPAGRRESGGGEVANG